MSKNSKSPSGLTILFLIVAGLILVNHLSDGDVVDFFKDRLGGMSSSAETILPASGEEAEDTPSDILFFTSAPTATQIPVADFLPGVPEALHDHAFLNQRAQGSCATLCGDVRLTVFFVDDPESHWTQEEMDRFRAGNEADRQLILSEAQSYGAELNLTLAYETVTVEEPFVRDDSRAWADAVLFAAGLSGVADAAGILEERYGVDEAPVLFYRNASGRAYAVPYLKGSTEYTVMFNETDSSMAFRHELFHLFGAKDFYYPDEVVSLAKTLLPNSIMTSLKDAVTDPLTAYLIGWTQEPGDIALQFLQETSHVTTEYLRSEHEQETYTGYVENRVMSNGTYTGNLLEGLRQGYGRMEYDSGAVYEGDWQYNLHHGEGTYTWASGMTYTGSFAEGYREGYGVLHYESGAVYEGEFAGGDLHGWGKIVWNDGTTYEGEWFEGERHGQGTLTFASGTVQSGRFEMGEFVG